ncbi:MAG TPA: RNA helicase [Actinobacteria bacterium]|jgi:superfamily II DNA/RNA helicase|nr:RNA helicase [Actinomycetota bacterium]HCP62398.1 RNA helicase [Actinomycetota bacterium]
MHIATFPELGVSTAVTEALAHRDIIAPFAIQTLVMKDALAGRDILGRSRTGSGKTLGFAIPIVERAVASGDTPQALVLVPTRELAVQVTEEFAIIAYAKGLRVASVYGGVSLHEQAKKASRAHILVATPGRLEDVVTRKLVSLQNVRTLVLDEADRMLDMGFQPQVDALVRRLTKDRQTMFFSATLDGAVGYLAQAYTRDPVRHEVEAPKLTVDEVEHRFVPVKDGDKVRALVELLSEHHGPTLVFVRTKRGADRLAHKLKAQNLKVTAMHGDLSQAARESALRRFETGKVDTLIATDVAARGLDVDNISHVVNFDPPEDDKAYVHRVGRTARAGKSGVGVTLVLPADQGDISRMAARLKLGTEFQKDGMKIAPPRVVFSGHRGRHSMLGKRPRRAF